MALVGTVPVKVNGRHAVTLTDFSYDLDRPVTVKSGAFGPIDTAIGSGTGGSFSFKLAIRQENGVEFTIDTLFSEFSIDFPLGPNRYKLLGCNTSKEALSVQQAQGNADFSINGSFRVRKLAR